MFFEGCKQPIGAFLKGHKDSIISVCCALVGAAVIFSYYRLIFKSAPLIHSELIENFIDFVRNPEVPWYSDFMQKIFDLKLNEGGAYRPRLLGYMIHYIDVNLVVPINMLIPRWDFRLPLSILFPMFYVFSVYRIGNIILPHVSRPIIFLFSSSILYLPNILVTQSLQLRSAKILAPSLCLFLLAYLLENYNKTYSCKGIFKLCMTGFGVFLLMLVDEQVIAAAIFVFVTSVVVSVKYRRISKASFVFCVASLLYLVFYCSVGRKIYEYYTGPLVQHPHGFSDVLNLLSSSMLRDSFFVWSDVLRTNFIAPMLCIFFIVVTVRFKQGSTDVVNLLVFISMLAFSFALTGAIVASHPVLLLLSDVRAGMYFVTSTLFAFAFFLYGLSLLKLPSNVLLYSMCLLIALNSGNVLIGKRNYALYQSRASLFTVLPLSDEKYGSDVLQLFAPIDRKQAELTTYLENECAKKWKFKAVGYPILK